MLDVSTGKTLPDVVHWVKFSNISWTKGDNGFFYSRYPTPPKTNAINQEVVNQQLYFHALGQAQSADRLIYRRPDLAHWIIQGQMSEDGHYLFVFLIHRPARPDRCDQPPDALHHRREGAARSAAANSWHGDRGVRAQ